MMQTFIVNFAGQTSPPIIHQLAKITHENGGKWLVSKINYLDEQVSGLIKIKMPTQHIEAVKDAFTQQKGLTVYFADSTDCSEEKTSDDQQNNLYNMRVDAEDRGGIVHDISQTVETEHGQIINIESNRVFLADSLGVSASMFSSHLTVTLPTATNIQDVISELETLGMQANVVKKSKAKQS
ncbi:MULTISPECIES: glycine cleavage system protein R [Vibrio]|uniref:Glycine cleavage system transcriptional repressor n=1 Tax=Vibrio algicola TaxID=2662262 RepID=A0A5Q0THR4_9VIBR|nr:MULTISPECIES: ACT domain-containing protein [Vibrio]MBD1577593.1 transcriptional regulator [Vibrio sp. S11_S32]